VIEAALREARVTMRLSTRATAIAPDGVVLSGAETLPADAVVLATGMVAAPFAACIPGPRDALGRVEVDAFLRAPSAPHVFVTGDAAAADTGGGHIALQSCQHALRMGRFAGANAARDLRGEAMQPYAQHRYVTCLDLGRSGAVRTTGWDRQVVYTGAEGKKVKRSINTEVIYPPAAASRAELLAQAEPVVL
jgi:NADH dehydrogenase